MAEPAPLLGPTQRKIAAAALTLAAALLIVLLLSLLVLGLSRALGFFSSVLWPLAVAGIVACILQPVVGLLERRMHVGRLAAVTILYGAFVLALTGLVVAVTPVIVAQTAEFADTVPELWTQASGYAQKHYPEWIAYGRERMQNPTVKQFVDGLAEQAKGLFSGMLPGVKAAASDDCESGTNCAGAGKAATRR